uniref:Uncharacterized protein n=1 Tax=Seriola lalandi dorsalis TaxID=1841481 RepID=A0A3B4XFN6_SERLL
RLKPRCVRSGRPEAHLLIDSSEVSPLTLAYSDWLQERGSLKNFTREYAQESWQRDSHDMRFKRLQHLLQKSNIYSKFLLTKMEQQQNEVV